MFTRFVGLAIISCIGVVGCGNAPNVSVEAEKPQVVAGESMWLDANVDAYQGTRAVAYYWTIITADCGDLSGTTGRSTYWTAPRNVSEPRVCQISVEVNLRDGSIPSYEETVTTSFFINVVPYPTTNYPPVVTLMVPVQSVFVNESVSLSVEASDPEGGPLMYQWRASGGTFIGSITGTGAAWVAPVKAGEYTVHVVVTDRERASTSRSVMFTVVQ